MIRILELLKKSANLLLFTAAISQIFLYEVFSENLEKMIKMEIVWRFLVNFGA
ncbi:MAG: hypothetical protein ACTTKP_05370 [Catonella sp.]|uniref:hypothetical protein n=1 Tax=Catonella sp. TaxID=2382125 RepID=UPI003F9F8331